MEKFSPRLQPNGKDSGLLANQHMRKVINGFSHRFEWTHSKLNGSLFLAEVSLISLEDELSKRVQVSIRDITKIRAANDQMREFAFNDSLTNLSTRRLLGDRLSQILLLTKRSKQFAALFFIDVDGLKNINDLYGHPAGDTVLQDVAKELRMCVRAEDTVARIGGDEFVVLINALSPDIAIVKPEVANLAEKMVNKLSKPASQVKSTLNLNRLNDHIQYHYSVSIGIVLFSGNHRTAEKIMTLADAAMYKVKRAGGNGYQFSV